MLIPSRFRIKRNQYTVHGGKARAFLRGKTHHDEHRIWVYERDKLGNPMPPYDRRETFFHELTHAVLHEMKHPLWCDEAFVQEFSCLFAQAIHTSTFDKD